MAPWPSPAAVFAAAILAFVFFGPSQVDAACGSQLLSQDFNQYTSAKKYDSPYPYDDFPDVYQLKNPNCVAGDGELTATFPKGMILGEDTGCSFFSGLSPTQNEVTLQYSLYFQPGFQWTLGGKLPGLCGGECPRGCDHNSPGWSARLMWRKEGKLVTYVYWPEMGNDVTCGVDWEWDVTLSTGVWYTIGTYVKMNTPGQHNGVAKGWVNGKEVFSKSDIMWMTAGQGDEYKISAAYITTYVGGSTYDFAPTQDQYLKFDNIAAWTGLGPCSPGTGGLFDPAPAPVPDPAPVPAPVPAPEPAPVSSPPPVVLSPPPVGSPPPAEVYSAADVPATEDTSPPPPADAPGCSCKRNGVNPDLPLDTSAPRVIGQYVLYRGQSGWDLLGINGDQVQVLTVSGSLYDRVVKCAAYCNRNTECDNFTLHIGQCTLRKSAGATPQRFDQEESGYRFLYYPSDDPFAASVPDDSEPAPAPSCVCDETPPPPPAEDPEPAPFMAAPHRIGQYSLFNEESDWDIVNVPGDQLAVFEVGGNLYQRIGKCANYCNLNPACANFTLHISTCTIRKDVGATPTKNSSGGPDRRFLYTVQ